MATIKKGTYRFNDTLILPETEIIQSIDFETAEIYIDGYRYKIFGSDFVVSNSHLGVYGSEFVNNEHYTQVDNASIYSSDGWFFISVRDVVVERLGQIVNFYSEQEVSQEFAAWFAENTKPVVKKFNRLYSGDVAYSSGGKCFKRLTTEQPQPVLAAGLYDAEDNLVASWDTLVNTYGMDCETDYTSSNYNTTSTSPYCVLTKNSELANGRKLIIADGVTKIGSYAFYNCSSLTSITIPDSVTSIGGNAFDDCNSLTSVYITDISKWCAINFANSTSNPIYYAHNLYLNGNLVTDLIIPDNAKSIGQYAFFDCRSLTSVTIGNSVTSIGSSAFYYCSSLTSVTIGNGVTSIGDSAFYECENLKSITIPDSVTSIGWEAFWNCLSLMSITIPNSVTIIGDRAFWGCSSLERIAVAYGNPTYHSMGNCIIETETKTLVVGCKNSVIPTDGSVTSIGDYAFASSDLMNITIPDGIISIGDGAFEYCSYLTSVTIPDSVTSIKCQTFRECMDLMNVVIGDSVTLINHWTFWGCTSLTSIIIPDNVTSIGLELFNNCRNLKTIYCEATSKPSGWNSNWLGNCDAEVIWGYSGS